jgi:hypothetical protein
MQPCIMAIGTYRASITTSTYRLYIMFIMGVMQYDVRVIYSLPTGRKLDCNSTTHNLQSHITDGWLYSVHITQTLHILILIFGYSGTKKVSTSNVISCNYIVI